MAYQIKIIQLWQSCGIPSWSHTKSCDLDTSSCQLLLLSYLASPRAIADGQCLRSPLELRWDLYAWQQCPPPFHGNPQQQINHQLCRSTFNHEGFLIHLNEIFIDIPTISKGYQPTIPTIEFELSVMSTNQLPLEFTGLLRINSIPNTIAPKDKDFVLGTQSPLGDLRPTSLGILFSQSINTESVVGIYGGEFSSV